MNHEDELALHLRASRLPAPERQYRLFALHVGLGPGIKERLRSAGMNDYRFDFAWPDIKLAVEVNGGIWLKKGGHNTGRGIERDLQKSGAAMKLGWTVYSCTPAMIKSGDALQTIEILIDSLT